MESHIYASATHFGYLIWLIQKYTLPHYSKITIINKNQTHYIDTFYRVAYIPSFAGNIIKYRRECKYSFIDKIIWKANNCKKTHLF